MDEWDSELEVEASGWMLLIMSRVVAAGYCMGKAIVRMRYSPL